MSYVSKHFFNKTYINRGYLTDSLYKNIIALSLADYFFIIFFNYDLICMKHFYKILHLRDIHSLFIEMSKKDFVEKKKSFIAYIRMQMPLVDIVFLKPLLIHATN